MAKKEENKVEKKTIEKLVPGAVTVTLNGEDVRLAVTFDEDQMFNAIVHAQSRHLVQNEIKKWRDLDATMTPKDLKDIMSAVRDMVATSKELYGGQNLTIKTEVPVQEGQLAQEELQTIDIGKLTEKHDDTGLPANP